MLRKIKKNSDWYANDCRVVQDERKRQRLKRARKKSEK